MNKLFFALWNIHILLESLPISSSGHLALLNKLYAQITNSPQLSITSTTEFLMHIPTAFVISAFIGVHYIACSTDFMSGAPVNTHAAWFTAVIVADMITGISLLALAKCKPHTPLAGGFLISAAALLSLYFLTYSNSTTISLGQAALIGCAQAITLFPGISRLAVTFVVGVWLGLAPQTSALFSLSCELALIAAALLKAGYAIYYKKENGFHLSGAQIAILFISSCLSYALLELVYCSMINKSVIFFGWYLLAVAIITAFSNVCCSNTWFSKK